jgi:hypothetical protein
VAGRGRKRKPAARSERVIGNLARDWEGRIDVQLLGPMAAYDFTETAGPES